MPFRRVPIGIRPAGERARLETLSVFEQTGDIDLTPAHPERLGNFWDATGVLRMPKTVGDGSLPVADHHGLLFGDPELREPEILLWLDRYEVVFVAVYCPCRFAEGGADIEGELWLSDHPMQLHRGGVREEVVLPAAKFPGDDVGVAHVFRRPAQLKRNQVVQAGAQTSDDTPLFGFVDERARRGAPQASDLFHVP
jgi:hypothetical protein